MESAQTLANTNQKSHNGPGMPVWYQKRSNQVLIVLALIVIGLMLIMLSNKQPKAAIHTVPTPQIAKVSLTKDSFSPATVTIKAGNIVQWTSTDDSTTHIVAANPVGEHTENKDLVSQQLGIGAIYRYKFTKAGTYHYHDELNPTVNGMVVVQ